MTSSLVSKETKVFQHRINALVLPPTLKQQSQCRNRKGMLIGRFCRVPPDCRRRSLCALLELRRQPAQSYCV